MRLEEGLSEALRVEDWGSGERKAIDCFYTGGRESGIDGVVLRRPGDVMVA